MLLSATEVYGIHQNLTYFILVNGVHGVVTSSEPLNFLHCKLLLLKQLATLRHFGLNATDFGLNAIVRGKKISLSNKRKVDHT